jgi:hypothetical protein
MLLLALVAAGWPKPTKVSVDPFSGLRSVCGLRPYIGTCCQGYDRSSADPRARRVLLLVTRDKICDRT